MRSERQKERMDSISQKSWEVGSFLKLAATLVPHNSPHFLARGPTIVLLALEPRVP